MESSCKRRKMESEKEKITFSTSLFDLPLELLIHLGKYLKLKDIFNFRCYSRYSREVGNAMLQAARKLSIIRGKFPKNEEQLCVIVQQCRSLRKLSITWFSEGIMTNEIIESLLSNNPHLEKVDLGFRGITTEALTPLATKCKKLVKLSLSDPLPRDGFVQLFNAHNNHLLEMNFNFAWESNDGIMELWELLKCQPKLQRITLPELHDFAGYGPYYEGILGTIAEVCKELTNLEVPWNIRTTEYHNALRKIADNCPKLTDIDLTWSGRLPHELQNYLKSKNIEMIGTDYESVDSDVSIRYYVHDYDFENDVFF